MSTQNKGKIGVVLMTYGSATTSEHVQEYFDQIYKGKASLEVIADFENRYRLVGHSPLVAITVEQARLLEEKLGNRYVVRAGMRHSAPFINDAVGECVSAGATSLVGIILSPQFSSFIMEGYKTAFLEAVKKNAVEDAVIAEPWPTEEHFIDLLVARIKNALASVNAPIIFTTHSLPKRVVEQDPDYLAQLRATIDAITKKLDPNVEWYAAYQSAGHTPEEWLTPDLVDVLKKLREQKVGSVLIVPIQFLADHLEVLYDLDIAARKQCEELGIAYHRIELPNTDPQFIDALAAIAANTVKYPRR